MRTSLVALLLLAIAALPGIPRAWVSAPHDKADTNIACHYCHTLATRTGVIGANFNNACTGCHTQHAGPFGFPWPDTDQAVPGTTGTSHNWSGPGNSPEHGAVVHLGYITQYNWAGGNLQCIVCHEVHKQAPASADSMHVSVALDTPRGKDGTVNADTTGAATMSLSVAQGTQAAGIRVRIRTVTATGGTFIISHDYGWSATRWIVWNGSAWVEGDATGNGFPFNDGQAVPLDTPGATVKFANVASAARVGDYWDLYVGYPFLRYTNSDDGICIGCHQERVMNHLRARGLDRGYLPNGVRKFSHPVGVGLNANGYGTDRAAALDADGSTTSSSQDGLAADGVTKVANKTNDLVLNGGIVRCTTCHAVHNTDSNSLSVDVR
jgi:hypothetical protein